MKVAILGDLHIGVRNDLESIAIAQSNFFRDVFFPEINKRGIKDIIQMGDLWDKRQYLTLKSMDHFEQSLYSLLEENDCHLTMLLGNHDVLYKNTNAINSPDLYLGNHDRITVINEPTVVLDGTMLMVPWINKENHDKTLSVIAKSDAPYCLGHFELVGFDMHPGQPALDGLSPSMLSKFTRVLSGHYHTISEKGNILYTGVPYEMTWAQHNDKCGFWIFDTETNEIEFIKNPESLFFKVVYDSQDNSRSWTPYKPEDLTGKFVKVIVTIKDSHYDFDLWLKRIQSYVPQELTIFDNNISIDGTDFEIGDMSEGLSNLDIIENKIDNLSDSNYTAREKSVIKERMNKLYTEVEV